MRLRSPPHPHRILRAFAARAGIIRAHTPSGRVTFIAHSFGAVISRAALRTDELKPLLPKLHTYISLSGPHLGMMYGSNPLVDLGIWGMRKWRGARCLTELSLKDEKTPTDCYLYHLSRGDVLRHFRHVLLVSSAEVIVPRTTILLPMIPPPCSSPSPPR